MARTGVKAWLTRIAAAASLERSAYVWIASLLFLAVCLLWQPLPGVAWEATGALRSLLYGVQLAAWCSRCRARRDWTSGICRACGRCELPASRDSRPWTRAASFRHRGQLGVSRLGGGALLEVRGPYRWLRHPIYLGWVLLVFGAPTMTTGRLLFAVVSTAYLVVAIPIEERR